MTNKKDGFTLLELLMVIIILGVLSSLISGNFISSLKKGRDARRKTELEQLQRALENYYEDNRAYPAAIVSGGQLCHPDGCASKIYMQKVPVDPLSQCQYYYISSSPYQEYKVYATIENALDAGPNVVQSGYTGTDCDISGSCTCRYGVSSSNSNP